MTLGGPEGMRSIITERASLTTGQRRVAPSKADERRAYNLAARRDGVDSKEREGTCQRCLMFGPVQMDHRQNRLPGNTVPSNLQALCPGCHLFKTEHPVEALREGWSVPRHTIVLPCDWPARRQVTTQFGTTRLTWVLYFDAPIKGRLWREVSDAEARMRMDRGVF